MHLHYRSYGSGEPLLILHGLFGSLDNWHSISLKLGERFRVLAIDQRNHGHSPHHEEMSYPTMAGDLSELLQQEGISQANVLGHSMGGKTAMHFALLFPDQVRKLIVVDIAPRVYSPRHEIIIRALRALDLSTFESRRQLEQALAGPIPDLALRQFLLKNILRTSEGRFAWRIGLAEIERNYPALRGAIPPGTIFSKPVLFVRGERSDFLHEDDLPMIHRLFPAARLETIPKAGHLVHIENQAHFLSTLLSFLAEPAASPDISLPA